MTAPKAPACIVHGCRKMRTHGLNCDTHAPAPARSAAPKASRMSDERIDEEMFERWCMLLTPDRAPTWLVKEARRARATEAALKEQADEARRDAIRQRHQAEALQARVEVLEGALREIVMGKVAADNEHPLGAYAAMAFRFHNIARAALSPPAPADGGEDSK